MDQLFGGEAASFKIKRIQMQVLIFLEAPAKPYRTVQRTAVCPLDINSSVSNNSV